jgi:prophage maintenance system killer protein
VASRAAHLLYFVIKNHPLADGNKRVVRADNVLVAEDVFV